MMTLHVLPEGVRQRGLPTLRRAGLAVVLLTLSTCTVPAARPPAPTAIACGSPSPVDPQRHLAVVGPLLFAGGFGPHAIVGDFEPGVATKVGITALRHLSVPVELRGWDCASGQPLRFWYKDGYPFALGSTVSAAQLATTGDLVAVLEPTDQNIYPGYMLFTHAGLWKVAVTQNGQPPRSVVFAVLPWNRPPGST